MRLRLVTNGIINPDGTTLAGIEIDMPRTTKTYWRVPGDTGLPTQLDFTGSTGIGEHMILWPYPTRHEADGFLDYAYFGPTLLPVSLEIAEGPAHIELDAVLGICSEICIPAQAHFSLPLADGAPDRANGLRIRQAMAEWPLSWDGSQDMVGEVTVDEEASMLEVKVSPDLDSASLIAATAPGEPLFGAPQKSREPNLVLIPVLGADDPEQLRGQDIEFTFKTDQGAFQLTRTVGEAPEGQARSD